jgi:hypothetical protein
MSRRTAVLSLIAVMVAVLAWRGIRTELRPSPIMPSMDVGELVPVADYRISGPYTHENLAVFLIHGSETLDGSGILTLQQALDRKKAVVHETGSVHRLAVEALSPGEEVFVQSGDIVKGGKQDRTLPYDTLVPAVAGQIPVESFCVEQGRWSKRGDESSSYFSCSPSSLSTSELKRAARVRGEASQAEVWRNVARTQERLSRKLGVSAKADASASSLQLTLEHPALRAAVGECAHALAGILDDRDDVIGCAIAVNGRVVSADVYASRALFRRLWPKLLEAGAIEAFIEADSSQSYAAASEEVVRDFLIEADGAAVIDEAVTERTYVRVRGTARAMVFDSCDRSRDNLVLHRSFLAR